MMRNSQAAPAISKARPWIVPKAQITVASETPSPVARPACARRRRMRAPGSPRPADSPPPRCPAAARRMCSSWSGNSPASGKCRIMPPQYATWQRAPRSIRSFGLLEQPGDHGLCVLLYLQQMLPAAKAFGIDLVDLFRAGGARSKPAFVSHDLDPAERLIIARRVGKRRMHAIAGQLFGCHLCGRELLQNILLLCRRRCIDPLVEEFTQFMGEVVVNLAGITTGPCGHLGGQQAEDQPVLVRRPDRPIEAQERCPGAFLAAEADRAVEQTIDEPFEADRHLDQFAAQAGADPIDDGAADDGLADGAILVPARAMVTKIGDGGGEVVVGIH